MTLYRHYFAMSFEKSYLGKDRYILYNAWVYVLYCTLYSRHVISKLT